MMYAESTTAIPKSRNNFKEQSLVSHRAVFTYFHFALRVSNLLRNMLLCFRVLNSESMRVQGFGGCVYKLGLAVHS